LKKYNKDNDSDNKENNSNESENLMPTPKKTNDSDLRRGSLKKNKVIAVLRKYFASIASKSPDIDLSDNSSLIILPNSIFSIFWFIMVSFVVGYNLLISPYNLAFNQDKDYHGEAFGLEFLNFFIYFLDIIIQLRTPFMKKYISKFY
jgi:hypothetical protein